jgi:hypothetical protein
MSSWRSMTKTSGKEAQVRAQAAVMHLHADTDNRSIGALFDGQAPTSHRCAAAGLGGKSDTTHRNQLVADPAGNSNTMTDIVLQGGRLSLSGQHSNC